MTAVQEDAAAPETEEQADDDASVILSPKDDEAAVHAHETEESVDESDEAEDPGNADAAAADEIDMDDDFALLAMAKERLANQQEKQEAAHAAVDEEDNEDGDIDDKGSDEEDDELTTSEYDDASQESLIKDEQEGEEATTNDNDEGQEGPKASILAVLIPEPQADPAWVSPTRRERDENAELWALLRQSKSRVAETKDLVLVYSKKKDGAEGQGTATHKKKGIETYGAVEISTASNGSAAANSMDEEEESKRNFKQENRELWELLAKSKSRLEEAALQKMKDAEKAAAADEALAPPTTKREENPYKDLQSLPDEVNADESDDAALTQKELLLAMAVAEEAARSGKEIFATPSKEELRTRDIDSFEFLKKETIKLPAIPEKPIGNDAKEEERERSRLAFLSQKLSQRWTSFRQRMNEIDQSY